MDNKGGLSVVLLRDECSVETPAKQKGSVYASAQRALYGSLFMLSETAFTLRQVKRGICCRIAVVLSSCVQANMHHTDATCLLQAFERW